MFIRVRSYLHRLLTIMIFGYPHLSIHDLILVNLNLNSISWLACRILPWKRQKPLHFTSWIKWWKKMYAAYGEPWLQVSCFPYCTFCPSVFWFQVMPNNVDIAKVAPTYHLYLPSEIEEVIGRLWGKAINLLFCWFSLQFHFPDPPMLKWLRAIMRVYLLQWGNYYGLVINESMFLTTNLRINYFLRLVKFYIVLIKFF